MVDDNRSLLAYGANGMLLDGEKTKNRNAYSDSATDNGNNYQKQYYQHLEIISRHQRRTNHYRNGSSGLSS